MENSSFGNIVSIVEAGSVGNFSEESNTTESGPRFDHVYCEPIESLPLALVSGIIGTVTIMANLLVILAILKGSSRFHRPMYWLIIHLSVADLIVGIMLLWNYCVAALLGIHNTLTSILVVFCIWVTSEAASTLGFILLAVDRYVLIFHKSFHRTYATRVTIGLSITTAWIMVISVFAMAPMLGWSCKDSCECQVRKYMQCLPRSDCSQIVPPFKKSYTLTMCVMLFACIPLPIGIYSAIFIKVRRKANIVRHSHRRHDMRLIKTLSVILLVFILALSPVAILAAIDYVYLDENAKMVDVAFYIFVIAFLNSLANPLLYMWRMTAIRRSIRKIFCVAKNQNVSTRRDLTSFQSEQRSPTTHRQIQDKSNNVENQKFLSQNNGFPRAATLCLRQIKRGKYTNSRTSTPLSERASNNHLHDDDEHETVPLSKDLDREIGNNHDKQCLKEKRQSNCEITEL